ALSRARVRAGYGGNGSGEAMDWSIAALNAGAGRGVRSCAEIVTEALARAGEGEGARVFRTRRGEDALTEARAYDQLRASAAHPSPLAGLPVSIKDNIDVAGEVSAAGSKLLLDSAPATDDAPVVQRLKRAGGVIVGRTNMSEFAFTGIGHNPHFGTPANPFDRATGRIPGGSSAGAAVSVADRMAVAALGTDTGGSVRIPAALTGLVGFKPTKRRVSTEGVVPLSTTLDCVGPIAATVADCALLDAIISGEDAFAPPQAQLPARLWLPARRMLAGADDTVQRSFAHALKRLGEAGVSIAEFDDPVFEIPARIAARGSLSTAEMWERFGDRLRARRADVDPHVLLRVERGASMTAADYIANLRERAAFIRRMDSLMAPFDAMVAPTVPIVAPRFADIAEDENFHRLNLLILRNAAIANLADRPSISIPCHREGEAPVGLMLIGHTLQDARLLGMACAIEHLLRA
ncbi:MAG TPA: amidase, partial [Vicinamibacterales bacterium]